MADPAAASQQLFEAWRRQFEEGANAWARVLTQTPAAPPDPTRLWAPMMEQWVQAWARTFAQTPMSPDLLGQWKQFLDQSIEAWSRALGDAMHTDQFAQLLNRYLDQWLVAYGPMKKAAEQANDAALQVLNLASRSQVAGVARQIVELEERIERLEDAIGAVLKRLDQLAPPVSRRQTMGQG
jgi:hypothetical protein